MLRLFYLFIAFTSLDYLTVFAVDTSVINKPGDVIDIEPYSLIENIITYAIGIAAILGVIGITWGGIQMVIASGEEEKQKKGKNTILYSIIGVIVAGLAYSAVNIIGNFRI